MKGTYMDINNKMEKAIEFCHGYKKFINKCKTARECIDEIERILILNGYKKYIKNNNYAQNDKIYINVNNNMIIASKIGSKELGNIRINISHVDSPRLDLKPNVFFENGKIVYYKTHYYGYIKNYQWMVIPLAVHCNAISHNGEYINFTIGERETEPVFYISDLAPHLSSNQLKKNLSEAVTGEDLNVIASTFAHSGDQNSFEKNIMENVFKYFSQNYNINEKDLLCAELEFVPAIPARDIGLDSCLIGGYGQDDRACAYAAIMAEVENTSNNNTSVTIFTDKEETGSDGMTGAKSEIIKYYLNKILNILNLDCIDLINYAKAVSSDATIAYDPTFSYAFDSNNAFYLHKGCYISKCLGGRGKFGSCECSIEYMSAIIKMLDRNYIDWQVGEMGKLDSGIGATMSKFISNLGIDIIEMGIPIMSMHSPYEVTSKLDIYNMYLAFKNFLKEINLN